MPFACPLPDRCIPQESSPLASTRRSHMATVMILRRCLQQSNNSPRQEVEHVFLALQAIVVILILIPIIIIILAVGDSSVPRTH